MDTIEAQGVRLIVDSSSFEMLSARDPFTPQVPQEEIRAQRAEPIRPVGVNEPVVLPPPPAVQEPSVSMPRRGDITRPPRILEPLPDINIAGVVWNTDRPQAIINGQIVGIGDTVSGVTILDIKKMGITVLFQGRTETLEIK
jgi:hypothetical protein